MTSLPLSPRETQVLTSLSKGFTPKETALLLKISTKSVYVYICRASRKLNSRTAVSAVVEAIKAGIV